MMTHDARRSVERSPSERIVGYSEVDQDVRSTTVEGAQFFRQSLRTISLNQKGWQRFTRHSTHRL